MSRTACTAPLPLGRVVGRGLLLGATIASIACGSATREPASLDDETLIARIRTEHAAALIQAAQTLRFRCPDDPVSGTFEWRTSGTGPQWLRVHVGYEHGSRALEVLLREGDLVFVEQSETTWGFDADAGDGESIIETTIEERYYLDGNRTLLAEYREAEARSRAGERIDDMLDRAPYRPHVSPQETVAMARARGLRDDYQARRITESWCGPDGGV